MVDADTGSRLESAPKASDMPSSTVPRSAAGEEKLASRGHSSKTPKSARPPLSPEWHRPRKKPSLPQWDYTSDPKWQYHSYPPYGYAPPPPYGYAPPPPPTSSYAAPPQYGYEPTYGANSSRTRHSQSGTPPNGSSDSARSKEHEGRDEDQPGKGVPRTDSGIPIVTTCVPAIVEDDIVAAVTPTASPVAPLKGEDDDVPLSQVFRLGGPLVEVADEQHKIEVNQCAGESHFDIEALLRGLEGRVAAVETSLSKAVSGISSVMKSVVAIKNHLNLPREAGGETTSEVDGVRIKEAVVAAAGPSLQRVQCKVDDVARGTSSCNPVVLQEDISSGSEEKNKVYARARSFDSPAKRVQTNPRKRLLALSKFKDNLISTSTYCNCCFKN